MPQFIAFVLFILVSATSSERIMAAEPSTRLAVVGADVLPMTGPERLKDQTVLIEGDRIVQVGPRRSVRVPAHFTVIQGAGLTLMPGLVDMHVHLAPTPGQPGDPTQRALAVMLAHGVTTARSMAGAPAHLEARKAVEEGRVAGPRLYAAAPGMNVANTTTPEAARAAVRKAKQAGYDLIKSHHLDSLPVWEALQDEARRQGLPTAGHVANAIGLERAMAAGQQVEHLDGALFELLPQDSPARAIDFAQIPPPPVLKALMAVSDADMRALAERVAARRSWQVPTLSLFAKIAETAVPTETLAAAPEMRFVPAPALQQWAAQREQMKAAGFTPELGASFAAVRNRLVRAFHAAGVPLMTGSDTAQAFHIWGPGLIEEIEALAGAGLSNLDALRAATVVPRDYFRSLPNGGSALGWKADFGTVEPGARADLILLDGDPSVDLTALRRLQTVIAGGRLYDRTTLNRMLSDAATAAKAATPAAAAQATAPPVYVMRHLPAVSGGSDPSLTQEGSARAAELASFLAQADLKAVFVTPTRRSVDSAAAVAAQFGLTPTVYDPANPADLVAKVRAVAGPALVLGHSNTVHDLVARFGGAPIPPLGPNEFGGVWRVDGPGDTRAFRIGEAAPAKLGACGVPGLPPSARCGTVTVPENRASKGGRTLEIRFAVVPSTGPRTDDPLVFLPGGPGLGGVASGQGTAELFGPMLAGRDLVLIDQRGTGASGPLGCPSASNADALLKLGGMSRAEVVACREALLTKADLRFYTTREATLDMEVVRAALGYAKLDLFGMSYGTRLALDYLRLFPSRVGETVIRAAAPTEMRLPLWTARDSQTSFDRVAAACAAQADCAARRPKLKEQLATIVTRLDRGPVPIRVVDPRNGNTIETTVSREDFGAVLFILLYIPEFYTQLPPLMDRAVAGDLSPMVQAVAPMLLGLDDQLATGLRWSVICNEDVRRIDPKTVARATAGTFMGQTALRSDQEACALWPRAAIPADYFEPLRTDKPILVISGEMDPVAGAVWGEAVVGALSNSAHVEVPGASHLPVLPGCTAALAAEVLSGKSPKALDLACAAATARPTLQTTAPPA